MNKQQLNHFARLILILITFGLVGCNISASRPPSDVTQIPVLSSPVPSLEIISSGTEPIKKIDFSEKINQDNRGGSLEITQSFERSRIIRYTIDLGSEISVNANGEAVLPVVGKIAVGTEVAARYGVSYGKEDSISRSVEVKAAQGTYIRHTISHVEFWETGTIRITADNQIIEIPYQFRRDFGLDVKSENLAFIDSPLTASTSTITVQPTSITATSVLPTATSEPMMAPTITSGSSVQVVSPRENPCVGNNVTFTGNNVTIYGRGDCIIKLAEGEVIAGTADRLQEEVDRNVDLLGQIPCTAFIIKGPIEFDLKVWYAGWDYYRDANNEITIENLRNSKVAELERHPSCPGRGISVLIVPGS